MSLTESKDFSLVATATTLKLFWARIREISFPIPLDPPVTIAVFVLAILIGENGYLFIWDLW